MAGFADIFAAPKQAQATPMAAPGLPMAALSGNPAATVTNLAAIGGANAGGAFGNALGAFIGELSGAPVVDPMAIQQNRQKLMLDTYQAELRRTGSIPKAIDATLGSVDMPVDERAKLLQIRREAAKTERGELDTLTTWVNNQKQVKNYIDSYNTLEDIKRQLAKDDDPQAQALALLNSVKLNDPGVAVTQGEFQWAKRSAAGQAFIGIVTGEGEGQIDLRQVANIIESNGKAPTLSPAQKLRWIQGLESVVEARKQSAQSIYSQAESQWTAPGRNAELFRSANSATFQALSRQVLGGATFDQMGKGTMIDDIAKLDQESERLQQKAERLTQAMLPAARLQGQLRGASRAASVAGTVEGGVRGASTIVTQGLERVGEFLDSFGNQYGITSSDSDAVVREKIWGTTPDFAVNSAQSMGDGYLKRLQQFHPNDNLDYLISQEELRGAPVAKQFITEAYLTSRKTKQNLSNQQRKAKSKGPRNDLDYRTRINRLARQRGISRAEAKVIVDDQLSKEQRHRKIMQD